MNPRGGWIRPLLLALLSGFVLWGRVHWQFEPIRWKVATSTTPSHDGRVSFVIPPSPRLTGLQPPVVFIARVRNTSVSELRLDATIDQYRLATTPIPPASTRRVDIAGPPTLPVGAGSTFALQGAHGEWSLEYLEIANVHGSSRGFLAFLIAPRTLRDYTTPSHWLVMLICVGILALALVDQPTPRRRGFTGIIRAVEIVVAVFFAAALLSPIVTPFKIPGFLQSLHVGLPESIAASCLLAGYWCWLKSKFFGAALFLGFSLLVPETGAILLAALVLAEVLRRRQVLGI